MRIAHRDPTLKYPRAIREEKRRLVLDWLLEFQFSSVDLLARRLGLTSQSSYKFFRSLLDDQIIQHFKSVHTHQARYLMLTKAGVGLLQVAGRDVAHAQTQSSRLNRYAHLMHDLAVQAAVLTPDLPALRLLHQTIDLDIDPSVLGDHDERARAGRDLQAVGVSKFNGAVHAFEPRDVAHGRSADSAADVPCDI